jgi:hypothetical protein
MDKMRAKNPHNDQFIGKDIPLEIKDHFYAAIERSGRRVALVLQEGLSDELSLRIETQGESFTISSEALDMLYEIITNIKAD